MKNSIQEFPGDVYDLPKWPAAAEYRTNHVKINNSLVYLFLIAGLACFHNLCAATGNGSELLAVKDRPVNVAPLHNPAESHGNGGVIAGQSAARGGGSGFFDLLLEAFKPAPPDQASPNQINNNGGGESDKAKLVELNANIKKLHSLLLDYFLAALFFFLSVPALIFYWARGSLKSDRRMIEIMKYNLSGAEKQIKSRSTQDDN